MKDRYGREIKERRRFDGGAPPEGVSKMAIRIITILLFMTAAVIFFFPTPGSEKSGQAPDSRGPRHAASTAGALDASPAALDGQDSPGTPDMTDAAGPAQN
jgi:hypothetical protein